MNNQPSDQIHRADLGALVLGVALAHLRTSDVARYSQPDEQYTAGYLAGLEVVAAGVGLTELTGELHIRCELLTSGGER